MGLMDSLFGPKKCKNCGRKEDLNNDFRVDRSGLCDRCRVLNTGKGAPKDELFRTGLEPSGMFRDGINPRLDLPRLDKVTRIRKKDIWG